MPDRQLEERRKLLGVRLKEPDKQRRAQLREQRGLCNNQLVLGYEKRLG